MNIDMKFMGGHDSAMGHRRCPHCGGVINAGSINQCGCKICVCSKPKDAESESPSSFLTTKNRQYSYRDMLECWVEARKNLVEWGVGNGDKPDFSSWMSKRFNDTEGCKICTKKV